MRRPVGAFLIVSAILAAGVVGLAVGRSNSPLPGWLDGVLPAAAKQSPAQSDATGPVIYYRDPDGLPDYSLTPKKTSMGMDYLPVYEGDEDDDSSVKVSAGKLQKAGVQTELVERRTLNTVVRAPGTVQEDERRRSVVSLRFEGFIDTVENVTTGAHVHKGQRLMRIYGPNLSSAAAEYLSALNAR